MYLSGEYDIKNIIASTKEVASGLGYKGEITIGDMKLAVGYGMTIEFNDNDGYTVNGENYSNYE
jgi:hypothetical protein